MFLGGPAAVRRRAGWPVPQALASRGLYADNLNRKAKCPHNPLPIYRSALSYVPQCRSTADDGADSPMLTPSGRPRWPPRPFTLAKSMVPSCLTCDQPDAGNSVLVIIDGYEGPQPA